MALGRFAKQPNRSAIPHPISIRLLGEGQRYVKTSDTSIFEDILIDW